MKSTTNTATTKPTMVEMLPTDPPASRSSKNIKTEISNPFPARAPTPIATCSPRWESALAIPEILEIDPGEKQQVQTRAHADVRGGRPLSRRDNAKELRHQNVRHGQHQDRKSVV